ERADVFPIPPAPAAAGDFRQNPDMGEASLGEQGQVAAKRGAIVFAEPHRREIAGAEPQEGAGVIFQGVAIESNKTIVLVGKGSIDVEPLSRGAPRAISVAVPEADKHI